MEFKYTNINLETATREEIQNEIDRMQKQSYAWKNEEGSIKLCINGIYGALGNKWLVCFDPEVAETVTSQGQDLIKFAEVVVNAYFAKFWHLDKELHAKLGLTTVGEVKKPVNIYIDTDSVDKNSVIHSKDFGKITIANFWNMYAKNGYTKDKRGNELVNLDENQVYVENWDKDVKWSDVKRIIRHKVTKKKYKVRTKSGKDIIITGDHSIMVIRDGKKIKMCATEIDIKKDLLIGIDADYNISKCNMRTYKFEEIESVECIGEWENEYVYDLEMYDETHTFIANDILVHNSCYVCFDEVVQSCDWQSKFESPKEFILAINKERLKPYLQKQFDIYAKKWNTANQQDFELETISASGIWLAKKKYILDKVWEDGINIEPLTEIVHKGIELAQSSTPTFARKNLTELVKYVLAQKKSLDKKVFTQKLREIKDEFRLADPDTVSSGRSVNDYSKWIINDTTSFEVAKAPPIHVRAAGYYNYMLNKNAEMKQKYEMIRSGDKIKFYYVATKSSNENDVFAYHPGNYPYEFAPPINYDLMFEKTILDPMNRIIKSMGQGNVPPGLQIIHALF